MKIFKFIYEKFFRREYPMIEINSDHPYWRNLPDKIFLGCPESFLRMCEVEDENDFMQFILTVLEHEYLHYLLADLNDKHRTTWGLDKIHRWEVSQKVLMLGTRDKEPFMLWRWDI